MTLYISSKNAKILEAAEQYVEERISKYTKEHNRRSDGTTYETECLEETGVSLMKELLEAFAELDIRGTFISDVEGRDSSWWATATYESKTDQNGRRFLEVSSRVDWA